MQVLGAPWNQHIHFEWGEPVHDPDCNVCNSRKVRLVHSIPGLTSALGMFFWALDRTANKIIRYRHRNDRYDACPLGAEHEI